nr:potassium transporter [Pseudomonadota bacterium]
VLICVDRAEVAMRIAEHMKAEFPFIPVLARAFDRGTAIGLMNVGVEYQIRETFESALLFGGATLEKLGVEQAEVADVIADVRRRDAERLELQISGGLQAGRRLMKGNIPEPAPTPLAPPRRPGRAMNEGAADALGSKASNADEGA